MRGEDRGDDAPVSHEMSNVTTRAGRITRMQSVPVARPNPTTRASRFLDAEEARGSNPLAPTSKGPGHRPFSGRSDLVATCRSPRRNVR
jgi:hypothetical protein